MLIIGQRLGKKNQFTHSDSGEKMVCVLRENLLILLAEAISVRKSVDSKYFQVNTSPETKSYTTYTQ